MLRHFLIVALILIPVSTSALTVEEIQAQIQALLQEVAALQALLQSTETETATVPATTNAPVVLHCPRLTRALHRRDRDQTTEGEVTELQKFLAGYFNINPIDIVTGYFGFLTESRVMQFQGGEGLPQVGIVGPLTRAAISASCAGRSQTLPLTTQSCSFNGQTIADTAGLTAYQAPSVPAGNTCEPEWRTCRNGSLSGGYQYASCVVLQPVVITHQSCTWNGQTVVHGGSVLAYLAASVPSDEQCQMQMRYCADGILDGSYQHASCIIGPPPPPPPPPAPPPPAPPPPPSPSAAQGGNAGVSSGAKSCTYNGTTYQSGSGFDAGNLAVIHYECDNGYWYAPSLGIGNEDLCEHAIHAKAGFGCAAAPGQWTYAGVRPSYGKAPLAVQLTMHGWSTCPGSFSINWGDGSSEALSQTDACRQPTIMNTSHTYTSPGTFTVSVSNPAKGETRTKTVTVY